MDEKQLEMLKKIDDAIHGYETRIPIHFLLEFASRESVEALVARTALKNELENLIKNSTVDQQIIDARLTYDRLALVFNYIKDNIDYFNSIFDVEAPTDVSDVTFILLKGGS